MLAKIQTKLISGNLDLLTIKINGVISMDENKDIEISEDVTIYGENVPSTFQWVTPDKQRERARELAKKSEGKKNSPK